jgi:hypothetical protein
MTLLGIKSRQTLTSYCNALRIPHGLHTFNEDQFQRINDLRQWREGKGRISDFIKNEAHSFV